jgi:aarF domain-containing kinase
MDGIRLNDLESLEAYEVDKQKIVEEITRAYAHQIYIDGFFNGDPHPGILCISLCVCMVCLFMLSCTIFFISL